jgi:hypothetical protein
MAERCPTGTLRIDYTPSYDAAIAGKAGDVLSIVSAANAEWWTVCNARTKEQGFVPASFVVIADDVREAIERRTRRPAALPSTDSDVVRGGLKLLSSAASGAATSVKKGADTVKQAAAAAPQLDLAATIDTEYFAAVGTSISEGVRSGVAQAATIDTDYFAAVGTSISEGVRSGVAQAQESGTTLIAAAQDAKASVEQLQEERAKQQHEERRRIWTEGVLPQWQAGDATSRRVRRLVAQGIPQEVRPAAWMTVVGNALGLTRAMFEAELQPTNPLSPGRPEGEESAERLKAGRALIATDLERTFSKMGGCDHTALGSVLEAYLLYNHLHHPDESGYVQGMSFLAAVLLIHTDASGGSGGDAFPAFICLANLLEQPQRVLKTCLRLDGATTDILLSFWGAQLSLSLPRLNEHFGKETPLFEPFIYKMHHLTKTGSGQT